MVRIVPVPADTTFVVIAENPLQTFDVSLFNFRSEFMIILFGID